MNKVLLVVASLIFLNFNSSRSDDNTTKEKEKVVKEIVAEETAPTPNSRYPEISALYDSLDVADILKYEAFEEAMIGHQAITAKNKQILTVIDFTLPSTEKRMYVLDLENKRLLYHTIVSHGRNTGEKYATNFSNRHGSYQSSLGFYITSETYQGGNGFSLRLDGLERGINDQARARAVVIHGADYCSEKVIKSSGRLGRSYGCPALPRELNGPIINTIKNGSVLYIYADNQDYLASSTFLRGKMTAPAETMIAQHEDEDVATSSISLN